MRKILVVVLIFLGVIIAAELGFLWYTTKKNPASKNIAVAPSPAVTSPSPASSSDENKTKMLEHNFTEIYKDITSPKTDVLSSSVLTNTYQGKISKISKKAGVIPGTDFAYQLYFELKGEKGNTKRMFFNDRQIAEMEKQGFSDVKDLKVGDALKVTLTFSLLSPDGEKTTRLISSKIIKTN